MLAFGGALEASAAVAIGAYFLTALLAALGSHPQARLQRPPALDDPRVVMGLTIGTTRIWIVLLQALGVLSFHDSFGPAFWLSFVLHAVVAEAYLAKRSPGATPLRPPGVV